MFGVNTLGGPWDIVLHGGPDAPSEKGRGLIFEFQDPLRISGTAARSNQNHAKRVIQERGGVT